MWQLSKGRYSTKLQAAALQAPVVLFRNEVTAVGLMNTVTLHLSRGARSMTPQTVRGGGDTPQPCVVPTKPKQARSASLQLLSSRFAAMGENIINGRRNCWAKKLRGHLITRPFPVPPHFGILIRIFHSPSASYFYFSSSKLWCVFFSETVFKAFEQCAYNSHKIRIVSLAQKTC